MTGDRLNPPLREVRFMADRHGYKHFHLAPPGLAGAIVRSSDGKLQYEPVSEKWLKHFRAGEEEALLVGADQMEEVINGNSTSFILGMAREAAQKIVMEYPEGTLAIRGSAIYVDTGELVLPDRRKLLNPLEALRQGGEWGGYLTEAPTYTYSQHDSENRYDVRNFGWMIKHSQDIRGALQRTGRNTEAERVFPFLMFFDKTQMEGGKPKMVAAVIFDYPMVPIDYHGSGIF